MKYADIDFTTVAEAEAAIQRGDPQELLYVPLAVSVHSPDFDWAQGVCIRLATHPHFNVRGNAVLGFGHLARRFRRLDRQSVEPLMMAALADGNEYVRGHGVDASDDVQSFLGWRLNQAPA